MRTPLAYYGGKQMLARQIIALMPPHRVYLEAFAGGSAVLFAKPPAERETLNDLDGQVMRFWRTLRERPMELAEAIATTPYSRAEWYESKEQDDDDLEASRRLLVNVDQSFARSRSSWSNPCIGDGRGRWQPGTWSNLPPKLLAAAQRLQGVALEALDGLTLIPRFDRSDAMIYVDPPYTGPHRTERSKGYVMDADDGMWGRLVDVLASVERAAVIVSGYPCEEMDELGWTSRRLARYRTVQSRNGDRLARAPETVWFNSAVTDSLLTIPEMG